MSLISYMNKNIFLLVFFIAFQAIAQESSMIKCERAITIKPLQIFNLSTPNLSTGLLFKLKHNMLIELQGGYIYKVPYSDYLPHEKFKIQGLRANVEFKLLNQYHNYFSCQFIYNRYSNQENEYYLRYASTYQELLSTKKMINSYVCHIKAGQLVPLMNNKFLFDFNFGFGFRYKTVNLVSTLPEDAVELPRQGIDFSTNGLGHQILPSIAMGFSLGYIIK